MVYWRLFRAAVTDWSARNLGRRSGRRPDPRGFLGRAPSPTFLRDQPSGGSPAARLDRRHPDGRLLVPRPTGSLAAAQSELASAVPRRGPPRRCTSPLPASPGNPPERPGGHRPGGPAPQRAAGPPRYRGVAPSRGTAGHGHGGGAGVAPRLAVCAGRGRGPSRRGGNHRQRPARRGSRRSVFPGSSTSLLGADGWPPLGAGVAPIAARSLTPDRLAAAVTQLVATDAPVRAGAGALGRRIRQEEGVATTVRRLDRLFGG